MESITLSVSDFVAVLNQTLEFAYPNVTIVGELANVRVARGKWVYFDIKDEFASVKCFGTVFQLPGPIEDGMTVRLVAAPRMHPLYGFSLHIMRMLPVGEGSIKKAADLLQQKLEAEGLFDPLRKRLLPPIPDYILLITSVESAAYKDFIKVLKARWAGMKITVFNVQVQGEQAVIDITQAFERITQLDVLPDVVVVTRGGGSADDLAVFNVEQVVRAVAASRVPTLVAIGHERDISLAELAADKRASTPSNAAELLVPDKSTVKKELQDLDTALRQSTVSNLKLQQMQLSHMQNILESYATSIYEVSARALKSSIDILELLNPRTILRRGYTIVRDTSRCKVVRRLVDIDRGPLQIEFYDGTIEVHKE